MATLTLRGSLNYPHSGSLGLRQQLIVRVYRWNPTVIDGEVAFARTVIRRSTYAGTLDQRLTQPLNFRGGRTDGVYQPVLGPTLLVGSGETLFSSRSLHLRSRRESTGSTFSEFAIWPLDGVNDPTDFYVEETTQNVDLGGLGKNWTRHHAIFAASRGYQISSDGYGGAFPRATYLAVGAKVNAVPAGDNHYFKMFMVEPATLDDNTYPSKYTQAREVQTNIRPDRLNYSQNPAFLLDTSNWNAANHGGVLTRVPTSLPIEPSAYSAQIDIPAGNAVVIHHTVKDLRPGQRYIASVHVLMTERNELTMDVEGATLVSTRSYSQTRDNSNDTDTGFKRNYPYRRVWVTFDALVPEVTINMMPAAVAVGAPPVLISGMLVEQGQDLGQYFDGEISDDYLWELRDTPGNSRSYYYKNLAQRYAAVKRLLISNTPMGIGIAEPLLGRLPEEENYGSQYGHYGWGQYAYGVYGDGSGTSPPP